MSSTISVNYAIQATVTETFSNAQSSDNTATFAPLNETGTLTASSTVPVTKEAAFEQALSGGNATITLTSLPGKTVDEVVDATGLKLQVMLLRAKSTNANPITITKGASNGYGLNAAGGTWTETLDAGQERAFTLKDSAPDVAAGACTFDVSGTGSQILECHFIFG